MDSVSQDELIVKLKEELNGIQLTGNGVDCTKAFKLIDQIEVLAKKSDPLMTDVRIPDLCCLFDHFPLAIFIKDAGFRIIYANKRYIDLAGFNSLQDIVGKTNDEMNWGRRECNRFNRMDHDLKERKQAVQGIVGLLTNTKEDNVWLEVRNAPFFNDRGELEGLVGSIEDVTEKHNATEVLKHTKARLNNYFTSATDAIFVLNQNFDITDVNPACCKLTGHDRELLIGNKLFHLFNDNESLIQFKKACKAIDIKPVSGECTLVAADCTLKHIKMDVVNIEIDHLVCFAKDISELKRAIQKAEESNRLKTAFLQNISHEIRTPLNAIIGFANILRQRMYETEEDADIYKKIIYTNSEYLLGLVNSVIDLSKIETGQMNLIPENIALIPFIKSMVLPIIEAEKNHLEKSNIHIQFIAKNISDDDLIHVDKGRLKQILVNLMHNALKFTFEGEVCLSVEQNYDIMHFEVSDTGIGISEDQINRIFHRFYKIQHSANAGSAGLGSGLGLAIVKKLLAMMGGAIHVESEVDKGSCFSFNLPVIG
jgi:PAS domain S-box-containing protein